MTSINPSAISPLAAYSRLSDEPTFEPTDAEKLFKAIEEDKLEEVLELLNKVDLETTDKYEDTPLLCALKFFKPSIALKLIEKGANVNVQNNFGQTPLMYAIHNENIDCFLALLARKDIDLDLKDQRNKTALDYIFFSTIKPKDAQIFIDALVDNGPDLNKNINKQNILDKALISAVSHGDPRLVEYLLSIGANINIKSEGFPIIYYALVSFTDIDYINYSHSKAKLLIEKGVNLNVQDEYGRSPLMVAISKGLNDLAEIMLEKDDIDCDAKDKKDWTALISAVCRNQEEIVRILIEEKKVNVNAQDYAKLSALDYAQITNANKTIIKILEQNGARHSLDPKIMKQLLITACKPLKKDDKIESQDIDSSKQDALVLYTTKDPNGAFSIERRVQYVTILSSHYNVFFAHVNSIEELNSLLKKRTFSHLSFSAHGNTTAIALSKTFEINLETIQEIALDALQNNALIAFHVCESKPFAEKLAEKAKELSLNLKFLATTEECFDHRTNIWFNEKGKLKMRFFADAELTRDITYKTKLRN